MKKLYFFIHTTILFLVISTLEVSAQPYYFYSELVSSNYNNIYRINLSNGEKDLFLEDVLNPLNFTWDNYQQWFFLSNRFGISIFHPESQSVIEVIVPNSNYYTIGVSSFVIPSKNSLYFSWYEEIDNIITEKTDLLNLESLQKIKECNASISEGSFTSLGEDFIYQFGKDSLNERFIDTYSIELDSIININYFFEIYNNESLYFNDGANGKILFSFDETERSMETQKYIVYDIENDFLFPDISFPYRSYGYLSPNAEYVILQKALWDTTKPSRENFNGEVSLYKTSTGELVKDFALPPDGKILLFDNYPNDVFYLVNYETEPEVYNLTRPVLTSISPAIVLRYISGGGLPSGLTVTAMGYNFSDSSIAYFNGNAKTTTIVSDTVLTFPITGSEMATLGNYPVWISSYGTNSDTLTFSVVDNLPQTLTPTLQCVRNMGDGSYWAYFGYNNNNSVSVYVPLGSKNTFAPNPIDRGQPKLFQPGNHTNVFIVVFNGKNLIWTLDQTSVTANSVSTPCP